MRNIIIIFLALFIVACTSITVLGSHNTIKVEHGVQDDNRIVNDGWEQ